MSCLVLKDFENTNLPELSNDMSNIMSLNTAFRILVTCEESEGVKYTNLSYDLKESVKEGLYLGIKEVDKITTLLNKRVDNETTNREKYYLYQLLDIFSGYIRKRSVIDSILKDELTDTDIEEMKSLGEKLKLLSFQFKKIKKSKRIKNTDLARLKLDREVDKINNNIFTMWFQRAASIDGQYE